MTSLRHHWDDGLYLMGKYPGRKCSGELSQDVTISTDRSNLQMIFVKIVLNSLPVEKNNSPMQCGLELFFCCARCHLGTPSSWFAQFPAFARLVPFPKKMTTPHTKSCFSTGSADFGAPLKWGVIHSQSTSIISVDL